MLKASFNQHHEIKEFKNVITYPKVFSNKVWIADKLSLRRQYSKPLHPLPPPPYSDSPDVKVNKAIMI